MGENRGTIKLITTILLLFLYKYIAKLYNERHEDEEGLMKKIFFYVIIGFFGLFLKPEKNLKIKHSAAKAGTLYYIGVIAVIAGVNIIF